jgi:hypothetical protein
MCSVEGGDLSSPAALQLYGLLVSLIKADASSNQPWCKTLHIPAGCASSACILMTITQLMNATTTAADSGLTEVIQALQGSTASSCKGDAAAAAGKEAEGAATHDTGPSCNSLLVTGADTISDCKEVTAAAAADECGTAAGSSSSSQTGGSSITAALP